MNKIIPFNKEIKFDNNIGEITSIALEDSLKFQDSYTISGDLIVKGSHVYDEIEEDFSYPLPTIINVDSKYDTSQAKIMIDDFYYEILNDDTLKVKIDLILDNLLFKEKKIEPFIEEIAYDIREDETNTEKANSQINEENGDKKENIITDLFKESDDDKEYSVYRVYVVVDGDTLSKILEKYNITSEELAHYNDLSNIKPGMKLIIPSVDE